MRSSATPIRLLNHRSCGRKRCCPRFFLHLATNARTRHDLRECTVNGREHVGSREQIGLTLVARSWYTVTVASTGTAVVPSGDHRNHFQETLVFSTTRLQQSKRCTQLPTGSVVVLPGANPAIFAGARHLDPATGVDS